MVEKNKNIDNNSNQPEDKEFDIEEIMEEVDHYEDKEKAEIQVADEEKEIREDKEANKVKDNELQNKKEEGQSIKEKKDEKLKTEEFNSKKRFKKSMFKILVVSMIIIAVCIVIGRFKKGEKVDVKNGQKVEVKEIKIKGVSEGDSTEKMWMNAMEEKIEGNIKMQEGREKEYQEKIERIKREINKKGLGKGESGDDKSLESRLNNLIREVNELKTRNNVKIEGDSKIKNNNINQYKLNLDNAKDSEHYQPIKTADNYIPAGSFARAVLLSGVDAATGLSASSDPEPILIRIVDHGTLPRK